MRLEKRVIFQAKYFLTIYSIYIYFLIEYSFYSKTELAALLSLAIAPIVELSLSYSILETLRLPRSRYLFLPSSFIYLILTALITGSYVTQCYSLHTSGSYLTALAIENAKEIRFITSPLLFFLFLFAISGWTFLNIRNLSPSDQDTYVEHRPRIASRLVPLSTIYALLIFAQSNDHSRISLEANQTPILSLIRQGMIALENTQTTRPLEPPEKLSGNHRVSNNKFPLERDSIFRHKVPFETTENPNELPNVIVLFSEGISARLLECYGGKLDNLMPHISSMSRSAMRVDNYFNHTAATYRGLQGQMTSGYPFNGGLQGGIGWDEGNNAASLSNIKHKSLAHILNLNGYDTYFMSPHPNDIQLNTMLKSLGFKKVYSLESVSTELLDKKPTLTDKSLSDEDLFQALAKFLELRTHFSGKAPFFIGTYNIGTHAFLDTNATGRKYKDGKNRVLNRMHNYDHHVGNFIKHFFSSEISKNTILIITSDHATYPEPKYSSLISMGDNFNYYFIDMIPLIIYNPFLKMPLVFDAKGKTSLNFAPTLLHLLNINQDNNYFMGSSIFETSQNKTIELAAIGHDYYLVDGNVVHHASSIPETLQQEFRLQRNKIMNYYFLESRNMIAPPH